MKTLIVIRIYSCLSTIHFFFNVLPFHTREWKINNISVWWYVWNGRP